MLRKKAHFLVWVVSGSVTPKKWFSLIWQQHYKSPLPQTLSPLLVTLKGCQGYALAKGCGVSPEGTGVVVLPRWAPCQWYEAIPSPARSGARSGLQAVAEGLQGVQQVGDERFLDTNHHHVCQQQFGMSTHLG